MTASATTSESTRVASREAGLLTSTRLRIAVLWLVLFMVPIAAMGWAVGHYGPIADDWDMLLMAIKGEFLGLDRTRPLAFVAPVLTYHLAGGSIDGMFWQAILLHGIEAIVLFELLRRVFARLLGGEALFAAFAGALIYVLYPADVIRYPIVMIHGHYVQIAVMLVALMWMQMARSKRILWFAPILLLTLATLLTKEHALLLFGLLPALMLLEGQRPWSRRWIVPVIVWYVALAVYGYWRFFSIGGAEGVRSVVLPGIDRMLVNSLYSFYGVMGDIFFVTRREHSAAVAAGSPTEWLPLIVLAVSGLLVLLAWRITRQSQADRRILQPSLLIITAGVAVFASGLVPYLFWEKSSGFGLAIVGQLSRYTQIANFGAVLLWIGLPLFAAAFFKQWRFLNSYALLGLVTAALLTTAVIRQVHVGEDYLGSWATQREMWWRILEMPLDLPDVGAVPALGASVPENARTVMIRNFPLEYGNSLLTGAPWSYTAAFELLTGKSVLVNRGRETDWDSEQGIVWAQVTHHSEPAPQLVPYPWEQVRSLFYTLEAGTVVLEPVSTWRDGRTQNVLTGVNRIVEPPTLTPFGAALLGDYIPPRECRTWVDVLSNDPAPAAGTVVLTVNGTPIDRRQVAQGDPLTYNLLAPCDTHVVPVYTPADAPDTPQTLTSEIEPYITGSGERSADLRVRFGD